MQLWAYIGLENRSGCGVAEPGPRVSARVKALERHGRIVPLFFFFQAEDGIRDLTVTGVQTCALPIYLGAGARVLRASGDPLSHAERRPAGGRREGVLPRVLLARRAARGGRDGPATRHRDRKSVV